MYKNAGKLVVAWILVCAFSFSSFLTISAQAKTVGNLAVNDNVKIAAVEYEELYQKALEKVKRFQELVKGDLSTHAKINEAYEALRDAMQSLEGLKKYHQKLLQKRLDKALLILEEAERRLSRKSSSDRAERELLRYREALKKEITEEMSKYADEITIDLSSQLFASAVWSVVSIQDAMDEMKWWEKLVFKLLGFPLIKDADDIESAELKLDYFTEIICEKTGVEIEELSSDSLEVNEGLDLRNKDEYFKIEFLKLIDGDYETDDDIVTKLNLPESFNHDYIIVGEGSEKSTDELFLTQSSFGELMYEDGEITIYIPDDAFLDKEATITVDFTKDTETLSKEITIIIKGLGCARPEDHRPVSLASAVQEDEGVFALPLTESEEVLEEEELMDITEEGQEDVSESAGDLLEEQTGFAAEMNDVGTEEAGNSAE